METANQKTAVVTGAAIGIGRGIALALAKAGYNVIVSDLNQESAEQTVAELKGLGAKAAAIKCDVSSEMEVENLFRLASEKFGRIDVLVNNAGIYPYKPFLEMAEADWDKVMGVNLKSVFFCSRAAAKAMPEGGRIISISSIASLVGFPNLVHYCASKSGINGLTRALALELAPRKITVNAVAPGAIDTPGAAQTDDAVLKQTIAMIPLGRMGKPEDIAAAVVFLASADAEYITGQVIVVDGGWILR